MDLSGVLANLGDGLQVGTLESYTGGQFERGRSVNTWSAPVDVTFFTVTSQIDTFGNRAEEGGQNRDLRYFYFTPYNFAINVMDIITYEGSTFEVRNIEQRKEGNFVYVHGKRVDGREMISQDSSGV